MIPSIVLILTARHQLVPGVLATIIILAVGMLQAVKVYFLKINLWQDLQSMVLAGLDGRVLLQ